MGILAPWQIWKPKQLAYQDNKVGYSTATGQGMYLVGREFERWIDYTNGSARSNGYNAGGAIHNPAYVIESILRDEVFTERKLRIDSAADGVTYTIDGSVNGLALLSDQDDYYNNAIFYNFSTGHTSYITDYDGSSKTITVNDSDGSGGLASGNWVVLTNIQGDNRIDVTSFDAIGNTTNGIRDDYLAAASLINPTNAFDVIDEICRNFLLFLTRAQGKYKLFALDKKATADATWTNPLKDIKKGVPMVSGALSGIEDIYSEFSFRHSFNYQKGEYTQNITCSKLADNAGLGATYQGLCEDVETNYGVTGKTFDQDFAFINYGLPNVTSTMHEIAKKYIKFLTKRRWVVEWYGDFKNYCQYELGDQVKLNYPGSIPTALNNSAFFLIVNKQIIPRYGQTDIRFTLMQTEEI